MAKAKTKKPANDLLIDWDFSALEERAIRARESGKRDPILELSLKAIRGEISNRQYIKEAEKLEHNP
jgi:hypothetical protein